MAGPLLGAAARGAGVPELRVGDNRNDHDRYDSQNADGYRRSLTDVVNLAHARGGFFESGAGDRFRREKWRGFGPATVRPGRSNHCLRTVGDLPGLLRPRKHPRDCRTFTNAVKNNHRHNVVFIADVKNPCRRRPATPEGVCNLELPVGLRNFFAGLRADFPDRHFQVGLLRARRRAFTTFTEESEPTLSTEPSSSENTRPGRWAWVFSTSCQSTGVFAAGVHGLRASHEADRRLSRGETSPSALARWHRGIVRGHQTESPTAHVSRQTSNHWIRGFF